MLYPIDSFPSNIAPSHLLNEDLNILNDFFPYLSLSNQALFLFDHIDEDNVQDNMLSLDIHDCIPHAFLFEIG